MARRRGADLVVRGAALLAFVAAIYLHGYRPAVRADQYFDVTSQLTNTIRAANDGHAFASYAPTDTTRVVRIDEYASGHYDPGLPALISATALAGRAIVGDRFVVGRHTIYQVVFVLCVGAAVLTLWPSLPLSVSLGSLMALAASILTHVGGQYAFDWPRWWTAYATILVGLLLVGVLTWRPTRWNALWMVALLTLTGASRLLREEVVVIAAAAAGAAGLALGVVWVAARWWPPPGGHASHVSRLLRGWALVAALLALSLAVAPHVLRLAIAASWGVPYAATTPAAHGAGHSLYLALGYVPNSYGISWRDQVAMSHSHLIAPDVRVEDQRYQPVLRNEALRIVAESPWLLIHNVGRKTIDTARFLATSRALRVAGVVAVLAMLGALWALHRRRSPTLLVLGMGLLGLGAGASASALVIHPFYAFGTQAFVLLLACVLPPAAMAVVQRDPWGKASRAVAQDAGNPTGRAVMLIATTALAVLVACALWYATSAVRHDWERAALSSSPEPLADLLREGYRYARHFNDMPLDVQERLIAEMAGSGDPRVSVPSPPASVGGFRPVLVVFTPQQLHVVAWLGKEQPLAALGVGSAFAFVGYCAGCEEVRQDLPNDPYAFEDAHLRLDVAAIHNAAWADRYQVLTIPVVSPAPSGPVRLRLALQRIRLDDPGPFAFDLETDGTWQASFR